MARQFPRFLFSNPQDTKSKGPFIVHTISPSCILKVIKNDNGTINVKFLEWFNYEASDNALTPISPIETEAREWLLSQIIADQIVL